MHEWEIVQMRVPKQTESLGDKSKVIGGWLRSLTFAFGELA
jgi:hypothetical protein